MNVEVRVIPEFSTLILRMVGTLALLGIVILLVYIIFKVIKVSKRI